MWCHRAKHISLSTLAAYDFDVTSGGGTDGSWWTVLTRVYCGVNEQLVFRDTGQKRKIPQTGGMFFFFFSFFSCFECIRTGS